SNGKRKYKSRTNKRGVRLAPNRAFEAAQRYLNFEYKTLKEASKSHAVSVRYVESAVTLLKYEKLSGDLSMRHKALYGPVSLLELEEWVTELVKLLNAYHVAPNIIRAKFHAITGSVDLSTREKQLAYAKKVGPGYVWDNFVSPLVGVD